MRTLTTAATVLATFYRLFVAPRTLSGVCVLLLLLPPPPTLRRAAAAASFSKANPISIGGQKRSLESPVIAVIDSSAGYPIRKCPPLLRPRRPRCCRRPLPAPDPRSDDRRPAPTARRDLHAIAAAPRRPIPCDARSSSCAHLAHPGLSAQTADREPITRGPPIVPSVGETDRPLRRCFRDGLLQSRHAACSSSYPFCFQPVQFHAPSHLAARATTHQTHPGTSASVSPRPNLVLGSTQPEPAPMFASSLPYARNLRPTLSAHRA